MSGFTCPYCSVVMPISRDTLYTQTPSLYFKDGSPGIDRTDYAGGAIEIEYYICPNCRGITVFAHGRGEGVKSINTILQPQSLAKQYPDYVPEPIRNDYEEAWAIVNLSPKASATLSRRCLQNMIRDFWKISKNRLVDEIDALKDKVHPTQWKVIDSLRRIGNIGAHPEADINLIIDIEPGDAHKLLKVIEILIHDWYITRYEQEQLYAEVLELDETKKAERKRKE